MPVDIVPSKLTCKFLKPASCSTLELKGLMGSPKNLLVHMISAQGLRLEGQHTDWKTLPAVRDDAVPPRPFVFGGKDNIWGTVSCLMLVDEEEGSQCAVTESKGNSVFRRRKDSSGWWGILKIVVSYWQGTTFLIQPPCEPQPHIPKRLLETWTDVVQFSCCESQLCHCCVFI